MFTFKKSTPKLHAYKEWHNIHNNAFEEKHRESKSIEYHHNMLPILTQFNVGDVLNLSFSQLSLELNNIHFNTIEKSRNRESKSVESITMLCEVCCMKMNDLRSKKEEWMKGHERRSYLVLVFQRVFDMEDSDMYLRAWLVLRSFQRKFHDTILHIYHILS